MKCSHGDKRLSKKPLSDFRAGLLDECGFAVADLVVL